MTVTDERILRIAKAIRASMMPGSAERIPWEKVLEPTRNWYIAGAMGAVDELRSINEEKANAKKSKA